MAKDNHRKHQQLMTKLELLNIRIRAHEKHMNKVRRSFPSEQWENLVRELKTLTDKKEALNHEIRRLE